MFQENMHITDTIYDIVTWIYGDFVFVLLNLPQAGKLTYTAGVANVRNWNVSEVCALRTRRPLDKKSLYRHCLPIPLSSSGLQSMTAAQWLKKVLLKLCNKKWKLFNTETFFFPVYHARRVERIYLSINKSPAPTFDIGQHEISVIFCLLVGWIGQHYISVIFCLLVGWFESFRGKPCIRLGGAGVTDPLIQ